MSDDVHRLAADPTTAITIIDAAVAQVERRLALTRARWGTVASYRGEDEQTSVVVDGDVIATEVVNASGRSLSEGQRVFVQFLPPHGAVVTGTRPADPIDYTPELTNIDVGDGTIEGSWCAVGPLVHYSTVIVLGAGSSVSGEIGIGLPVVGSDRDGADWLTMARATIGSARYVGAGVYQATVSTTVVDSFAGDGGAPWSTSVPAAWGSGDILRTTGVYPRAAIASPVA